MKLSQFDFDLPKDRIATQPTRWRDECKLMVLHKDTGEIEHRQFKDIIDYFGKGDNFVLNDTKVFPAKLWLYITAESIIPCRIAFFLSVLVAIYTSYVKRSVMRNHTPQNFLKKSFLLVVSLGIQLRYP